MDEEQIDEDMTTGLLDEIEMEEEGMDGMMEGDEEFTADEEIDGDYDVDGDEGEFEIDDMETERYFKIIFLQSPLDAAISPPQ